MAARMLAAGGITLLAAMAASSDPAAARPQRIRAPAVPGVGQLKAFGGRSPEQRQSGSSAKFDGALADLWRHAALAKRSHALADLHLLSPAMRFTLGADGATPLVAVDAITRGDPQRLKAALTALGLEHAAVYANDVGGRLPVTQLGAAAALAELHAMRAAMPRTRAGAIASQGDFVQRSAALRAGAALSGDGVIVGVLSDSYDCYAAYAESGSGVPASGYAGYAYNGFLATAANDMTSGDLPASVNVLAEADCLNYGAPLQPPFADEGRAMLQIVHDVAPGAALAFYTAESSEADFAGGIGKLAAAGARVIADDVGYFDEPFYQDGLVAQAIDAVEAEGVAYFSAAGNDADASYENMAPGFTTLATSGINSGEYLLNFDTSNETTATTLPVTLDAMQPGELAAIIVEWDQPYVTGAPDSGGATSRIDLCLTGSTGIYTIQDDDGNAVTCTGANALGVDPVQVLIIFNPASATVATPRETLSLTIGLADGTAAPSRVKVAVETDGQTASPFTQFATHSATLQGHPGAAGAAAVGAAFYFDTPGCGTSPATVEAYSSAGGAPILFAVDGTRLETPTVRQKPDFVGPDGGNDTFLGYTLLVAGDAGSSDQLSTSITACQNTPAYPNFFGTSAATPHVAGIAALLLQSHAAATPGEIYAALRSSTLPMGGSSGFNYRSGFGFIQADSSSAALAVAAPTATASATATTTASNGGGGTLGWDLLLAGAAHAFTRHRRAKRRMINE